MRFLRGRKGSMMDVFYIMAGFVLVIIVSLVLVKVFTAIFTAMESSTSGVAQEVISNSRVGYPVWIDKVFFFLWLGMVLASIMLAFFVEYNPLLLPLSVVLYIAGGLYAYVLTKIINAVSPSFTTEYSVLPLLAFLSNNYLVLHVGAMALLIVAMYIRPSRIIGGRL